MSTKPEAAKTAAAEPSAAPFLKHAFDDLVHGVDGGVSGHEGFFQTWGIWTREHWEIAVEQRATHLSACNYLIDAHGIWLCPRAAWENQYDYLTWHPQAVREQGDDPRQSPVLPFPFTAQALAAYWLELPGAGILEMLIECLAAAHGDITAAAALIVPDPNSVAARQALEAAWTAWQEAIATIGPDPGYHAPSDAYNASDEAKASAIAEHNYRAKDITEDEKSRRYRAHEDALAEPRAALASALQDAERPHIEWRKAMVRALLPQAAPIEDSPTETAAQRQARRAEMVINAGLTLPANDFGRMPSGINALARREGISTQAFSKDVMAHVRRLRAK